MRLRPLAALSVAAVSALLLAGCAGSGGGTPTPSASGPAADLCGAQLSSGAASESVEVSGDPGTPSTATFTAPLEVDQPQVTVLDEGSGDPVTDGDFISYAFSVYDASTGDKLGEQGYTPGSALPEQTSPNSPLGQILGCGKPGERVVAVAPGNQTNPGVVYIFDLLNKVPTAAWGTPQAPVEGMPTVKLDDDGTPNITIDITAVPPAETEVETLKKGDGYTVQSGDQVLIQFRGARWSTGKLFDGGDSWTGSPYVGATTGFVQGFQKGLVGQTVGSQVLVVMTPEDGYGAGEINDKDLKGETLVFVIDILGAQSAAPQQ